MNITRRSFLKTASLLSLSSAGCVHLPDSSSGEWANDVHSQLNRTRVNRIAPVDSLDSLQHAMQGAHREQRSVSIAGGRHAMGGQQFGTDTVLLDTQQMNRVLSFDADTGIIEVEAGIEWPKLVSEIAQRGASGSRAWSIAQKQTGADRL